MSRGLAIVLLAIGALAFAFGLAWLLQMRLDRGDVYPPYSSLRSDPLGTMAFYESLGQLPGLTLSRDFQMTDRLPTQSGAVYMHLGAYQDSWTDMPEDLFDEIKGFLARGGRLVVVFKPMTRNELMDNSDSTDPTGKTDKNSKTDKSNPPDKTGKSGKPGSSGKSPVKKPAAADDENPTVSLKDKWGLDFDFAALPKDDPNPSISVQNVSGLALPKQLDWYSGLYFTDLDPAWQKIYLRDRDAVLIERHFGPGTVVMATDGYFMSNEALRKYRQPELLAWLVGSGHDIVFDEAHFGIVSTPGVAALIRRYHLVGLVGAFVLLALLFIWKNMSSLVPAQEEEARAAHVTGRDSAAGFVNLLRRNIPAGQLLEKCFTEWKKSLAAARPGSKVAEVQAVLDEEKARPALQRDAVGAYARIVARLKKPAFTATPPVLANPPSSL